MRSAAGRSDFDFAQCQRHSTIAVGQDRGVGVEAKWKSSCEGADAGEKIGGGISGQCMISDRASEMIV